jgi:transcription-repair coupling factor (superfamily II helicase)
MIRGAGDILGSEQSGFIDSVGIDMYLKMLQDTINEKKYNLSSEPVERSINISGLEAYIPDQFASKTDKFDLYLEIKQSKKLTSLKEVEQKVTDMYGKLPKPLQILFLKRQIELMINSKVNYVEDVIDGDTFIDIVPGQAFLNIPGSAVSLSNRIGTIFTNIRFMTSSGKIKVRIIKKGDWFQAYATLVGTIVAIVRDTINNRNETR